MNSMSDDNNLEFKSGELVDKFKNDLSELAGRLHALLLTCRDEKYALGSAIFVPGTPNTIGVRVPNLKLISRSLVKFAKTDSEQAAVLMDQLWQADTREDKLLAVSMIKGLAAKDKVLAWKMIEGFLPRLTDWEVVDSLALAMAPLLSGEHAHALARAKSWLTDSSTWIRRLGMVIVVILCHDRRHASWPKLADHLEHARGETHPTQLKALGWCWREIAKHDPALVFERLKSWAVSTVNGDRIVAWSGSEKCSPQQRREIRRLIDETKAKSRKK